MDICLFRFLLSFRRGASFDIDNDICSYKIIAHAYTSNYHIYPCCRTELKLNSHNYQNNVPPLVTCSFTPQLLEGQIFHTAPLLNGKILFRVEACMRLWVIPEKQSHTHKTRKVHTFFFVLYTYICRAMEVKKVFLILIQCLFLGTIFK